MLLFERSPYRHHRFNEPRPLRALRAKAPFAPQHPGPNRSVELSERVTLPLVFKTVRAPSECTRLLRGFPVEPLCSTRVSKSSTNVTHYLVDAMTKAITCTEKEA